MRQTPLFVFSSSVPTVKVLFERSRNTLCQWFRKNGFITATQTGLVVLISLLLAGVGQYDCDVGTANAEGSAVEWDAQRALKEWPDQRGIWAPVTWRDHLHEFNVLFNGTVVASSHCAYGWRDSELAEDLPKSFSLKIDFHDSTEVAPKEATKVIKKYPNPDGMHRSRWAESRAPVYVVEHQLPAILIEQRQFAHIPGGRETQRGDEPLFLWVRCEVTDVIELLNDLDRISCVLTPLGDYARSDNEAYNSFAPHSVPSPCLTPLRYAGSSNSSQAAYLWVKGEQDDNRSLLALPSQPGKELLVKWHPKPKTQTDPANDDDRAAYDHLVIEMPCQLGTTFDLVIPFGPVEDEVLERELALGFDGALQEAERFWEEQLKSEAVFKVPEPLVQGHLDHFAPLRISR